MDVHITAAVYKASVNEAQPPQILSAQVPALGPLTPHAEGLHA